MESHFEAGIENLRQKLLTMASHAEKSVNDAVQALIQRNHDLAESVKTHDDVIDRCEIEIDDLAINLLTKAPLATNLRLVTVAMKVSQNLERIGDEATKIAKRACDLSVEPPIKLDLDLPRMSENALRMLKSSLDAFVNRDSAAARLVIPLDKEVDALNKQIQKTMIDHMMAHPELVGLGLHWIVAAKSVERIADHAKNIAEEVVYLCEAEDIRHTGIKQHPAP